MKKFAKYAISALVIACMLAVAAAATAVVDYDTVEVNASNGIYKIVATLKNTDGYFATFKSDITFDNSIIVPVSAKTGSVANIAGGTVKTPIKITTYFDEDTEEDTEISHSPASPTWTVDGSKATLTIETYTTLKTISATNVMAFEMYFKYADGKSAGDLKEDSFVVDYVKYADHVTGIETYNAGAETDTLTVNNNVIPEAPAALKITVAKDDVIYLQDGSTVVADAAGEYEIPSDDGYVVVNTGYTAQKVYKVAAGVLTEETDLEDGVLASNAASLRKDTVATGLRMKASFLTSLKTNVAEYGYLVTAETDANALPEGYELNLALAESGKAKKGVAYSAADGTDIFFDVEGERTIVTAVAVGVPMTKEAVTSNIVFRPYYKLTNGVVVYGEPTARQVYEVAKSIKDENGETYAKYQEYIDSILALLTAEEERELILETGPLF